MPIFGVEVGRGIERRRVATVALSVAVHCVVSLLVRHATPIVLNPRVVMMGNHGASIAMIEIPSNLVLLSLAEEHTAFRAPAAKKQVARVKTPAPKAHEESAGAALQAARTGSPFGSQENGLTTGHELRPALPIEGGRPRVSASDLPGGLQGDVIVEITINEQGKVVQKKVIKSIDPGIDGKVLAALENWQFTPATQDGVAIPSQQYVYFHFPS